MLNVLIWSVKKYVFLVDEKVRKVRIVLLELNEKNIINIQCSLTWEVQERIILILKKKSDEWVLVISVLEINSELLEKLF